MSSPFEWVRASGGHLPANAVFGGSDGGNSMYVARGYHNNLWVPGFFHTNCRNVYVAAKGREHITPTYDILVTKPLTTFQWVSATKNRLPENAVCGGNEDGVPQYVARGFIGDLVVPGKFMTGVGFNSGVPGKCHVALDGVEHVDVARFEILVAPPGYFRWIKASNGAIGESEVEVEGGQASSGERYYVGRAFHEGTITVGKIHPSHQCCYIGYYGKEYKKCDYEVLVKN